MRKLLCGLLAFFAVSAFVLADDLVPPPWQRGEPGSTMTRWEFLTPDLAPWPDEQINPFGRARMQIYPTHDWQQEWGRRIGLWALSGLLDIEIDNNPEMNPYKLIQIQLTWAGQFDSPAAVPTVSVDAGLATGVQVDLIQQLGEFTIDLEPTNMPNADSLWHHTTYLYRIEPNPVIEFIDIGGSVWVDELVIDTICVPEPGTMVLLGFGALALLRKKR